MSDPLNLLTEKSAKYSRPDSSRSAGWVVSRIVLLADEENPLPLDCGKTIAPVYVEYEVYGELNEAKDNAILVFHALSGDAHVAGWTKNADELGRPWLKNRPGWWDDMVGPGKAFDTKKYFIICSNILGSCYGTTGPASIDPGAGRPYGLGFPVVTVGDWVRLQERLVTYLGIKRLYAVAGGSIGGQQALEWALAYPDRVERALIIASSARLSDQGLSFNVIARYAIRTDPNFHSGNYYGGSTPDRGLSVARMLGHITYLSEISMQNKFGRKFCNGDGPGYHLGVDFEVEGYLLHQSESFVERFDANSYLFITRAADYYDASLRGDGNLDKACQSIQCRTLLVSFSSDWLYPPEHMKELALAMSRNRKHVSYVNIPSSYGHDAFLLEVDRLSYVVKSFLEGGPE
ncbi:MAG TPA: homoserine O-acetyltransferase [Desulfotomaculum sp.]|nr:MAG: Homoserine O-acetyltransferase [Desulfotomaculum sp. 46_80]HAG10192.1 homoserine O-acetyltransferase [Desulfotomaculum sp.]HBY04240.1 homoserine O-acetyltransferase [Desulfotomaculum sp.]